MYYMLVIEDIEGVHIKIILGFCFNVLAISVLQSLSILDHKLWKSMPLPQNMAQKCFCIQNKGMAVSLKTNPAAY